MKTSHSLLLLSGTVAVLALSACGGGGGGDTAATASTPAVNTVSPAAMVSYMNGNINATSETSQPTDISHTELATDDTAEPASI